MISHCKGKEEQEHFGSEGKVYGVTPFSHCDSDCPYTDGTCLEKCFHLSITERPCLCPTGKIRSENIARMILREINGLLETGYELTEKQKAKYEFSKIFLKEIQKRRKKGGKNRCR